MDNVKKTLLAKIVSGMVVFLSPAAVVQPAGPFATMAQLGTQQPTDGLEKPPGEVVEVLTGFLRRGGNLLLGRWRGGLRGGFVGRGGSREWQGSMPLDWSVA